MSGPTWTPRAAVSLAVLAGLSGAGGWSSTAVADDPRAQSADASIVAVAAAYDFRLAGANAPLQLQSPSLLNWTNPERQAERGGMFVWTDQGRPEVIGSVFTYEHADKTYEKHEFQSLAETGLTAQYQGGVVWKPRQAGIEWLSTEAAAPSRSPAVRLAQMRAIARQYNVTLTNLKGEPTLLRFLAQPLLRYSSPERRIVDGAIFSYVVATDPEALLVVEVLEADGGLRWRYGFTRMHYWELSARNSQDELVWSAPLDKGMEQNNAGDAEHVEKIYNSFHPQNPILATVPATTPASP